MYYDFNWDVLPDEELEEEMEFSNMEPSEMDVEFDRSEYIGFFDWRRCPAFRHEWQQTSWAYDHRILTYEFETRIDGEDTFTIHLPITRLECEKAGIFYPFDVEVLIASDEEAWEHTMREKLEDELSQYGLPDDLLTLLDDGVWKWELEPYGRTLSLSPKQLALAKLRLDTLRSRMEADGRSEDEINRIFEWADEEFLRQMVEHYQV